MKKIPKALVIDDEPQVCHFVADVLNADGWNVVEANSAEQAFEKLDQEDWLLILCDVMLGETNGYQVLQHFAKSESNARFIMMTGQGSAAGALDAMAFGAYDYLLKPFSVNDVQKIARDVFEHHRKRTKTGVINSLTAIPQYVSEIPLIGKAPKFVECLKMVGRVAVTNLTVLITGESGTGKEVVARAIHQHSRRAAKPFVAVNCGAIPIELIESELFGHARGAFTGARHERLGLWEEAEGGTIFLDEITETNPLFQVKLLRVLQEGEIRRVGTNRTIKTNVRVIAATNLNIEDEVRADRFRQDLMYRLNAVTIYLPSLRERREDIPDLISHFASRFAAAHNKPAVKFSVDALEIMQNYNWPGNVRELENAVLYAASMCEEFVYPEHLPAHVRNCISDSSRNFELKGADLANTDSEDQWLSLSEMEAKYAASVLAFTRGNKQAASRILDIDRKTLMRILNRAKIET